jgi:hypothetical protein
MEKSGTDMGSMTGNRAAVQAKWTFMVYMAGDNNLDGAALQDIAEMAQAGSTKEVNIPGPARPDRGQSHPSLLDYPGR